MGKFWQAKDGSVTARVAKRVSSVLYLTVTDPRMLRPLKVSSSSERMTAVLRRCRSTVMYIVFVCVSATCFGCLDVAIFRPYTRVVKKKLFASKLRGLCTVEKVSKFGDSISATDVFRRVSKIAKRDR